jgi:hypothetical protein
MYSSIPTYTDGSFSNAGPERSLVYKSELVRRCAYVPPRYIGVTLLFLDQYYHDILPHRSTDEGVYNQNPIPSTLLKGRTGLVALGLLLLVMEANDFVLTTASNWSRLMDEFREMSSKRDATVAPA